MVFRSLPAWIVLLAGLGLAGCSGPYVLRGNVIQGDVSEMAFVMADDPRLAERPVGNIRIVIHRNPESLGIKLVGSGLSRSDGQFTIPLRAFGAGLLVEEFLIEAGKPGYQTAVLKQHIPGRRHNMHLLIILASGYSEGLRDKEDLWEQYERYR